ncbi:uncharacterized protein Z520_10579 [Fonsecaea multimorphosa CBS 102226]|uniref:Uncharacterized protein n=1 Tax=Fonsecaea multimorphosa CBS 102226 TaxID=1442371 RepID=A0A0D2KAV6_9EURO|nr:uncharacterized protein Z520_10579 [Fonsecaea multimorphosa CBS 102226]KIX93673.1 hypothetical protein Z520_10579 [Fonsecaea multimorphosa CBS 102226]OAL19785.1 hypothetical protein AYO22_09312 [Fonsecaea multimorphosa]
MDAPRLEIDQAGRARVVMPAPPPPPPKKPCVPQPRAPELVIDDHGFARVVFPPKELRLGDCVAVHLRVGLHPESYERTQLPEEGIVVSLSLVPYSTVFWLTQRIDLDVDEEVVPPAARFREADDRPICEPTTPQNGNLAMIPAPRTFKFDERRALENIPSDWQEQQEIHRINHPPVLPPVVWIKQADANTRLRHAVDVLTVNGEKYVRIDQTHFLYAVNADWLQNGENVTIRQAQYRHWNAARGAGRPEILFMLYPLGEWAYTPINNRRKKAPQEFLPQLDN